MTYDGGTVEESLRFSKPPFVHSHEMNDDIIIISVQQINQREGVGKVDHTTNTARSVKIFAIGPFLAVDNRQ